MESDLCLGELEVGFHVMWEKGDGMFGDGDDLWVEGEFKEGHGAVGVEERI